MLDSNFQVGVIEYHDYTFSNYYSLGRINYYGIEGYPQTYVDGVINYHETNLSNNYQVYVPFYNTRKPLRTQFQMDIYGEEVQAGEYNINVVMHKFAPVFSDHLVLHVSLTESHVPDTWWMVDYWDYMSRLMVPGLSGTALYMNDSIWVIPLNFMLEEEWIPQNCEIIAFIQDTESKEVYQADKVWLTDLTDFLLTGDFTAIQDTLEAGGTAQFLDISIGSSAYWQWHFPGGNPEFSNEKNPTITYNNLGSYDVSLIVSDGIHTETVVKNDFIHIMDLVRINTRNISGISIFPNPTDGKFTIKSSNVNTADLTLRIFNNLGLEVYFEKNINLSNGIDRTINISDYGQGVYLIHLFNDEINLFEKVILQK